MSDLGRDLDTILDSLRARLGRLEDRLRCLRTGTAGDAETLDGLLRIFPDSDASLARIEVRSVACKS